MLKHTKCSEAARPARPVRALNQVPPEILEDPDIQEAISILPSNYNFEIQKTIHRIRQSGAKNIALQFPEGLLLFAPLISDILTRFCPGTDTLIMGDVTYGACCVDDFTARALGCDLLVHYGHSCLVPMSDTGGIKTLYVFVTIGIDVEHLIKTIERNFPAGKKIALVGTIQFNNTLHTIIPRLRTLGYDCILPRSSPLSAGEILGCTAPTLTSPKATRIADAASPEHAAKPDSTTADMILYVGDGRFHLESILIASPALRASTYRYDPYARKLTHETYAHTDMHALRSAAIQTARATLNAPPPSAILGTPAPRTWGLILGTLGRQGNPATLELLMGQLSARGVPHVTLLLSEVTPGKLALMSARVGVWVQVACPRLSIDWGYAFERPLLSPYEAAVVLGVREGGSWVAAESRGEAQGTDDAQEVPVYPMDYYEKSGLGRVRAEDVKAAREVSVNG